MKIKMYDSGNIDDIKVNDNFDSRYALKYLVPMVKYGVKKYVCNVDGEMKIFVVNKNWVLPIFIPFSGNKKSSYVSSLYSHYITYAQEELKELKNKSLEFIFSLFLKVFSGFLNFVKIDECVYINNWLLSTNLYTNLPAEYIPEITYYISKIYKNKIIVWNSINSKTTVEYFNILKSENYLLLLSRSIYVQDKFTNFKSRMKGVIKREKDLLNNSNYQISDKFNAKEIKNLYNKLYLDKYSKYNPMFTEEFIKLTMDKNLLNYRTLVKDNNIEGVIGFFTRQNVMTTPILGYNTDLPKTENLYRILSIVLLMHAKENSYIFHQSAGAGSFKKSRGAKNYLEYRAVYLKNLTFFRKTILKILRQILDKVVKPLLLEREL